MGPNRVIATVLLLLCVHCAMAADAKTYRWVDENGQVYYSDTPPPKLAERPHQLINRDGLVVEENKPVNPETVLQQQQLRERQLHARIEQRKQLMDDRMLLASFSDEIDILQALEDYNKVSQQERDVTYAGYNSQFRALAAQVRFAAGQELSGLDVDQELLQTISRIRGELETKKNRLQNIAAERSAVEQEYESKLERYRQLKSDSMQSK